MVRAIWPPRLEAPTGPSARATQMPARKAAACTRSRWDASGALAEESEQFSSSLCTPFYRRHHLIVQLLLERINSASVTWLCCVDERIARADCNRRGVTILRSSAPFQPTLSGVRNRMPAPVESCRKTVRARMSASTFHSPKADFSLWPRAEWPLWSVQRRQADVRSWKLSTRGSNPKRTSPGPPPCHRHRKHLIVMLPTTAGSPDGRLRPVYHKIYAVRHLCIRDRRGGHSQ
jgi:hypothetical protein